MTSQIFKQFAAIVVFVFAGVVNINAQQANADDMLHLVAKLQRLEAMQPDSVGPKYQLALQSLNYAVMNPHAPQTENVLAQAEETISKMEKMKDADQSDLCTLRGFLYIPLPPFLRSVLPLRHWLWLVVARPSCSCCSPIGPCECYHYYRPFRCLSQFF